MFSHVKGKVLPYWLPSVSPGADPAVQVQPAGDFLSHPWTPGGTLPLFSTRPSVTFLAEERHHSLTGTKLYCLMTKAHRCEQFAQGCYAALPNTEPTDCKSNALLLHHCATFTVTHYIGLLALTNTYCYMLHNVIHYRWLIDWVSARKPRLTMSSDEHRLQLQNSTLLTAVCCPPGINAVYKYTMDTVPHLASLITDDGECTMEFVPGWTKRRRSRH